MKKILSLILCLTLILSTGISFAGNGIFSDIEFHWAKETIINMVDIGVLNGYPDGTFKPNNYIRIDEFIKIMVSILGYTDVEKGNSYWAENYINKALEIGIILEKDFERYDNIINRGEMARVLSRVLDILYFDTTKRDDSYKDASSIPSEFKHHVSKVYAYGLIKGFPDGTFGYDKNTSRAEAITVAERLLNITVGEEKIEVDEKTNIIEGNNIWKDNSMILDIRRDKVTGRSNELEVVYEKGNPPVITSSKDKRSRVSFNFIGADFSNIKAEGNVVTYKDVFKDIDIYYETFNNTIKENIKVNKYIPDLKLEFNIDSNLEYVNTGSEIIFLERYNYDEDLPRIVFRTNELFAIDNGGNKTYDISFLSNNDIFYLHVKDDWLKNAVYPITIDPAITSTIDGHKITWMYYKNTRELCSEYPGERDEYYYLQYSLNMEEPWSSVVNSNVYFIGERPKPVWSTGAADNFLGNDYFCSLHNGNHLKVWEGSVYKTPVLVMGDDNNSGGAVTISTKSKGTLVEQKTTTLDFREGLKAVRLTTGEVGVDVDIKAIEEEMKKSGVTLNGILYFPQGAPLVFEGVTLTNDIGNIYKYVKESLTYYFYVIRYTMPENTGDLKLKP